MSSSSPDVAKTLVTMDRQLSVKDKDSLVYLAEILTNGASRDKSLLTLLGDKFVKEERPDILRNLLELAGLNKHADSLRHLNHTRPPKLLEECQYVTKENCKLVGMRSCLIKLVSALSTDQLRTLLEILCHNSDSNPENYACIYILFRELEQKAIISPGRLEFIYEILENDSQFASVRRILVEYQDQFYNDDEQRCSSTGNNPVHVGRSCPPSNQVPNQPLYPAGSHSLRGSHNPPPLVQQRPIVPPSVPPPPHQIGGGALYQRQISAPPYNSHNLPHSQSNRLHQSDSFQRPMDWSPHLQRNQPVRPFPHNHPSRFDPQPTEYPQQPNQFCQQPNQYSDPPAPRQSNQYYRQQSDQSYRPPNQQYDQNHHPLPPQPHDMTHSSFHPSFSYSSQAPQYDQYYTRPVLPQDQRSPPPPPLPPSQQTGESLSTTRWLQQQGTMVGISSQQQQQQVIDQSMNVPPLPSPFLSGQMPQVDSYGAVGQLGYPTNSWPNEPAGPTVQVYSSSVAGAFDKPAIRSRQNSEPAGNSPSKRNPPPKKSNTLPEDFSPNSRTASNPQTSSSIHQQHVHISQSNSDSPAPSAGFLVLSRHQNLSPNSPGHSINVSVSRRTPSPAAQAASFHSNVSSIPYDVEPAQVQEARMKNEEEHM
ncbi:PREDICTED: trithorax group protein osa-like [Amphimedon queenslandica]|uniref:DED domain-containing protein n=1 Tax=Amphimedon queenslandica TaxID=400682 RepID=A0A1X7SXK5_AMPQE|nr:PREDICTED: trithorax group protein osa-like [Amphimedon queenslandica]|eukprot:XP_019862332.1 PREDICTED: trithorax group protein osa-like [Amphimedon queenslandica]